MVWMRPSNVDGSDFIYDEINPGQALKKLCHQNQSILPCNHKPTPSVARFIIYLPSYNKYSLFFQVLLY